MMKSGDSAQNTGQAASSAKNLATERIGFSLSSRKSRREFLITSSVALLGAASASQSHAQNPTGMPPGAPPAFGTAPAVGPEVSAATFAEAEKLVRVELTERDRAQAAQNWRSSMAAL